MTTPAQIHFAPLQTDDLKTYEGQIAVFVTPDGKMNAGSRKVNGLLRKAISRLLESPAWDKLAEGDLVSLGWPAGIAARDVFVVKLPTNPGAKLARKAGASLAKARAAVPMCILAGPNRGAADIALGLALRDYSFDAYRSDAAESRAPVEMRVSDPEAIAKSSQELAAITEGVFFARDLVNEPANVLTTTDFAARLAAMQELGLEVEILEEPDLEKLGMRLLLGVGQGSTSPSKVVVMRWNGGGDEAPLALVGKGVVFDTGGISIKPSAGMEEMTGDMGGASIVAGTMRALALSKAPSNVVGLIGLVENMPDGNAIRPGDVIKSMKGDTVEVINTDAEGRLVLADVMWYAQDRFEPRGMIDMATLTGAMLVALGTQRTGVFSNDDDFQSAFLKGCEAEHEGAWPMPCTAEYDPLLKSRVADVANVGGRMAGSITAARFLVRFVKEGTPWIHLDVAGTAMGSQEAALSPKGGKGWGVLSLTRMIAQGKI